MLSVHNMVHDEYYNCIDSALELNFDYDQALPHTEDATTMQSVEL